MSTQSHIRLLRPLGRGGSATVWAGYHYGLEQTVAVKRISRGALLERPEQAERLRREAFAASQIRSPHAVRILSYAVHDGAAYIVMERLRGQSLDDRLRRRGPMDLEQVEALVSQVCGVLDEAHALGIVHRDIKPGNLFVVGGGRGLPFVKVLDFGIAKWMVETGAKLTNAGNILGSPPYMSPEQFRGADCIDTRADLWSLAAVAYRALTGERPFGGKTLCELAMAVLQGLYQPPSSVRADLGPEVDDWFERAFALDIDDRFQTAGELASSFAALLTDRDELPTMVQVDVDWEERIEAALRERAHAQRLDPTLNLEALPMAWEDPPIDSAEPAAPAPRRASGWLVALLAAALVGAVTMTVPATRTHGMRPSLRSAVSSILEHDAFTPALGAGRLGPR